MIAVHFFRHCSAIARFAHQTPLQNLHREIIRAADIDKMTKNYVSNATKMNKKNWMLRCFFWFDAYRWGYRWTIEFQQLQWSMWMYRYSFRRIWYCPHALSHFEMVMIVIAIASMYYQWLHFAVQWVLDGCPLHQQLYSNAIPPNCYNCFLQVKIKCCRLLASYFEFEKKNRLISNQMHLVVLQ